MKTIALPSSEKCRVIYTRDGVKYEGIMPTPKTQQELLAAMSARNATVSNILRIEPFQSRQDYVNIHPAQRQIARLTALAEKQ